MLSKNIYIHFIFYFPVCPRRSCTKERKPVCGTNGQTYQNRCNFEVARCKSNGKIELKHDGVCNRM